MSENNTDSEQSQSATKPVIGIMGDGQLAMMMAQAYQKLGGKVCVLATSEHSPASHVADQVFVSTDNSAAQNQALDDFFNAVDVVTLENEFHDSHELSALSLKADKPFYPEPSRFGLIEDKLSEKRFFQSLGVAVADFLEIRTAHDLPDAQGYLKLAKGGYDGIGTYRVDNKAEAIEVFDKICASGTVLFEYAISYKKELSLIAVADGDQVLFYPLVETSQKHGTCLYVTYPSDTSETVQQLAQTQVEQIMRALNTKGLFAFEYFLTLDDELILNESAPRPHNSGHITLDLTDCSQFENHMRAVAGLPLVAPTVKQESMTMVNLLGTRNGPFDADKLSEQIDQSNASLTHYNKTDSRVKRKMGHVNLWGADHRNRAEQIAETVEV